MFLSGKRLLSARGTIPRARDAGERKVENLITFLMHGMVKGIYLARRTLWQRGEEFLLL